MSATAQSFRLPKRGNSPDEYEDACAADPAQGRFAVADGASESIYARFWAELLVEQFVSQAKCGAASWNEWLPTVQERWRKHFEGKTVQFYVEEKLREGSFAAFLGLVFETVEGAVKGSRRWTATAVGDTCVFHTRGDELCGTFPFHRSEQFTNAPVLLGSRTAPELVASKRAVVVEGRGLADDRLWLMTDALAQWFLQETEAERKPWQELERFDAAPDSPEAAATFANWVESLRDEKRIRNDDVTLLSVTL